MSGIDAIQADVGSEGLTQAETYLEGVQIKLADLISLRNLHQYLADQLEYAETGVTSTELNAIEAFDLQHSLEGARDFLEKSVRLAERDIEKTIKPWQGRRALVSGRSNWGVIGDEETISSKDPKVFDDAEVEIVLVTLHVELT